MDIAAELLRLEVALARRDEAAIEGGYDAVLDPAFEEVGRSGRVWTREAMLVALAADADPGAIELADFSASELAPDVWLVRFDTVAAGSRAHRSSVWVRSGGRLRLRFHQGTTAPEAR